MRLSPDFHTKHISRGGLLRRLTCTATVLVFCSLAAATVPAATVDVNVGPGFFFDPMEVTINAGDTVKWTWAGNMHSTTSGTPGNPDGLWDSEVHDVPFTFSYTFMDPGVFQYYCTPHGGLGMVGTVTVTAPSPTPTPTPAQSLNVSTRLDVGSGDNVAIGGIIITGDLPKRVLLRAVGPSLTEAGVANALPDTVLELHARDGTLITSNDNWMDSPDEADIEATGAAPTDPLESAIIRTLDPDNYTAIVKGKNGVTGVGLVEAYDLNPADSQLANISTRGFVESGDNVMIGGFILGPEDAPDASILMRAIGPSLAPGVPDALPDPVLELHNVDGDLINSNDNWMDNANKDDIIATTVPPTNDLESALLVTLPAGNYTAIVAGKNGMTGVALVEIYRLSP